MIIIPNFYMRRGFYELIKQAAHNNNNSVSQEMAYRLAYTICYNERYEEKARVVQSQIDDLISIHKTVNKDYQSISTKNFIVNNSMLSAIECLQELYPNNKDLVEQINRRLAFTFVDLHYNRLTLKR